MRVYYLKIVKLGQEVFGGGVVQIFCTTNLHTTRQKVVDNEGDMIKLSRQRSYRSLLENTLVRWRGNLWKAVGRGSSARQPSKVGQNCVSGSPLYQPGGKPDQAAENCHPFIELTLSASGLFAM